MNGLFQRSIEEQVPVEIIYMAENQQLTQRKMIVKEIHGDYIRAYCLLRKQVRTFKIDNILSMMPEQSRHRNLLY